jgi:tRNA(Ile)-lysidine synthase
MSAAMALLDTLRRTLDRHDLLRPGQSVMAAVSGGPDSLSLLHALHSLQAELQISALSAAHLDHGLRGEESAAESAFVAAFCAERGIPCYSETLAADALTHSMGSGLQAAARYARYDFLRRAVAQLGADRIATAHTQDDQVETILMRILRGSGLEGLRGIPYSRDNIIRPLRDTTRSEVEAYCAEHGLSPRRDPSNIDPSHYLRNKIRLGLLPELETNYAPGVRAALLRLSQNAILDDDYLQSQTKVSLAAIQVSESDRETVLSRQKLAELAPTLQRRTLRIALTRLRGSAQDIEERHIASFLTAILDPAIGSYSITLPTPTCYLMFTEDRIFLRLSEPITPTNHSISLTPTEICAFGEWTIEARLTSEKGDTKYTETLDADCVDLSTLCVRSWQAGDRIDVFGLDGRSKKLSDLFTDAKIPRAQRASIPIVADANGPLWVVGLRIAERARMTEGTVRFLRISAKQS